MSTQTQYYLSHWRLLARIDAAKASVQTLYTALDAAPNEAEEQQIWRQIHDANFKLSELRYALRTTSAG